MPQTKTKTPSAKRMALYRRKAKTAGRQRLEINLPKHDAELIRYAVDRIREGGDAAEQMRAMIEHSKHNQAVRVQSTQQLYELCRRSPFVGLDLVFERDKSLPPNVDLF
jgi:hypothetical protein